MGNLGVAVKVDEVLRRSRKTGFSRSYKL